MTLDLIKLTALALAIAAAANLRQDIESGVPQLQRQEGQA